MSQAIKQVSLLDVVDEALVFSNNLYMDAFYADAAKQFETLRGDGARHAFEMGAMLAAKGIMNGLTRKAK